MDPRKFESWIKCLWEEFQWGLVVIVPWQEVQELGGVVCIYEPGDHIAVFCNLDGQPVLEYEFPVTSQDLETILSVR